MSTAERRNVPPVTAHDCGTLMVKAPSRGSRHCTNVTTGRTRASLVDCGPRGMLPACGDAVAGSRLPSASSMTDTLAEIPMPVVRASYTALKTLRLRLRRAYRIVDENDTEKALAATQDRCLLRRGSSPVTRASPRRARASG